MTGLTFDQSSNSLAANGGGAGTNGEPFALPGGSASVVTWQSTFSSAPSSVTLLLQGSLDNVSYFTIDTSTLTAGDIRTVVTAAKFVRARISAQGSAADVTVSLIARKQPRSSLSFLTGGTVTGDLTLSNNANLVLQSGSDLTIADLTAGRIPIISTGGLVTDDGGLTYNSTTDILSVTGGVTLGADIKITRRSGTVLGLEFGTLGSAGISFLDTGGINYQNLISASGNDVTVGHLVGGVNLLGNSTSLSPSGTTFINSPLIINDDGLDRDTRIEGVADPNLFFVDASTDRVGIGTNIPGTKLEVNGTIKATLFTPSAQQTYTITNVTTDRAYDANATTVDELADALGTLIADLRTIGLVL